MAELMPIEDKFKPFSFFFALRILSASLRPDILMTTFFGPALDFIHGKPQYDQDELQHQFFLIISELFPQDHYQ